MVFVGRTLHSQVYSATTTKTAQDFTLSGIGTPDAIVVVLSRTTADDTNTSDASWCWGVADGAGEQAVTSFSKDASGTSYSIHASGPDLGRIYDPSPLPSAPTLDLLVQFNAWTTDGVTLDITNSATTAFNISILFLCGTSSAKVGTVATTAAIPGTGTVNNLTEEPDFVLTHPTLSASWSGASQLLVCPGIAANDGTEANTCNQVSSGHLQTTTASQKQNSTSYVYGGVALARPPPYTYGPDCFIDNYVEAGASSGFDFSNATSAVATGLIFLAVKLPAGVSFAVDTGTASPTAAAGTGQYTYTWPGHVSQMLYVAFGANSSQDTWQDAASGGVGFTDRIQDTCHAVNDANARATSAADSACSQSLIHCYNHVGTTLLLEATWYATNANGFVLDWTTVAATGRYFSTLSIEGDPQIKDLTGVASSVALGTTVAVQVADLTGVASSAAVGTTAAVQVVDLTGVASSAAVGTIAAVQVADLTALPSSVEIGTLEAVQVAELTGVVSSAAVGLAAVVTPVLLPNRLWYALPTVVQSCGEPMTRQDAAQPTVRQSAGSTTIKQSSGRPKVRQAAAATTVRQSSGK